MYIIARCANAPELSGVDGGVVLFRLQLLPLSNYQKVQSCTIYVRPIPSKLQFPTFVVTIPNCPSTHSVIKIPV